jgi:translation initiation factor 3 subunit M
MPAYNLLLHIATQAPKPDMFFARICQHLTKPMTTSPQHSTGIALSVLGTMFNIMSATSESRYHVFMAILQVIKSGNTTFDAIQPQLDNLEQWLNEWNADEDEQRQLYLEIVKIAKASGEDDQAYRYQLKALQTFTNDSSDSPEARELALDTLKTSLGHPAHFDFQDITALDAIQALRKSDPEYFELLELFTSEGLDELNDFKDEHPNWIEEQKGLDKEGLDRKMRLLTLASLAASVGQARRELSYESIAKSLQIPEDQVEMWIIDVIRAGLVEGKLSQLSKTFLIHRSTYRVFGDNQWREIGARLDMWKNSLTNVLQMVRKEREGAKNTTQHEFRDDKPAFRRPQRTQAPAAVEVEAE